jgi:5-(carboxyamino)imidazole ribonucleotide synthase
MPTNPLAPGAIIGILGGGQLGRMLALAAAPLGFRVHVFAPETDSPAFDVCAMRTTADYRDETALAAFAASVDVVTYEFENVPVETVRFLEARVPVRPGSKALDVAQDRLKEKRLARDLGARTAEFGEVGSLAELEAQVGRIGLPAVLKTTRFGYDGKGQAKIRDAGETGAAFAAMKGQPAILEAFVDFRCEVSVIGARALDGTFSAFDVTQNEHRNHILHRSLAPAQLTPTVAAEAIAITRRIAGALDYVGVLGVEFFALDADASESLCVNEIAPRVHNSGHWTQDGAQTSQFEQHIRAIAGWPLGSTRRRAPAVEMINLIGEDVETWARLAAEPGAHLHLYGKREARAGRKMGHVNRLLAKKPV